MEQSSSLTNEDYSLPANAHSFAFLLWEICTLKEPCKNCSNMQKIKEMALHSHRRPFYVASLDRSPLKSCWNPDPRTRPTFAVVSK
eukprot:scaffold16756_cov148-Amphora_coffeaeformis.AAC.3